MFKNNPQTTKKAWLLIGTCIILISFAMPFALASAPPPASNTTAPYRVTYTAKLTDASSAPITTPQNVRFSLWTDSDWDAGDVDGSGNINPAAVGYANWQETYAVTPNSDGIFSVELGSQTIFPNFTSATHAYLEVDVKPVAAANTAYEVLDPNGNTADTLDRKSFNSAPYAVNADTVDNHDAGNGPNNVPVLDSFGKLIFGVLPDGVNANTFTLDQDNNSPSNVITLQFGNALGEFLRYNAPSTRFEFSKSLNINGDLTFTGTGNITGATIDGNLNTITNIPASALAPTNRLIRLAPEFDGAALSPDGIANNGRMTSGYETLSPTNRHNYYQWTTGKTSSQTMDIIVRYQLPTTFVSFTVTPLTLTYETATATLANNSVNLTLKDSTGTPVTLVGAANLTSAATWTDAPITFSGTPTFTPGTFIEFDFKVAAINGGQFARIGDLVLNYSAR